MRRLSGYFHLCHRIRGIDCESFFKIESASKIQHDKILQLFQNYIYKVIVKKQKR